MQMSLPLHITLSPPKIPKTRSCIRNSLSSPMEPQPQPQIKGQKVMEFPHLSASHKDLMVGMISALENRLHSHLLPSPVPPDVEYYQNQTGTSQGTLHIRPGVDSSHIDFILASWLHLELPTGGAMNITNLQGYLKPSTAVPHFQFELVQCSPTYLIFFLDLTPRKDPVMYPDYLKAFYEETQLDTYRQKLYQVPETKPYFSSSLYFRQVVSPTGILVSIKCDEDGGSRIGMDRCEEIIREHVSHIAYDVMGIWLDKFFCGGTSVGATESAEMAKRDRLIKSRAIEMDLSTSMPQQFGEEVSNRVLGFIKGVFNV